MLSLDQTKKQVLCFCNVANGGALMFNSQGAGYRKEPLLAQARTIRRSFWSSIVQLQRWWNG